MGIGWNALKKMGNGLKISLGTDNLNSQRITKVSGRRQNNNIDTMKYKHEKIS